MRRLLFVVLTALLTISLFVTLRRNRMTPDTPPDQAAGQRLDENDPGRLVSPRGRRVERRQADRDATATETVGWDKPAYAGECLRPGALHEQGNPYREYCRAALNGQLGKTSP
jgi:hypothetical protein